MNIGTKKRAALIGFALATVLSFAASGQGTTAGEYRFETIGQPSGIALTVRLIDSATGQSINDAHIFAVHRQWLPVKGEPRFVDRRIPLTTNGTGGFTYESNDVQAGATIRLVAQIDSQNSDISGSVQVSR